jgi:hypothetical protein
VNEGASVDYFIKMAKIWSSEKQVTKIPKNPTLQYQSNSVRIG